MNIGLRLAGLVSMGVAIAAIYWMVGLMHAGQHHPATPFECLLALVGFAGTSAGSILLSLGTHIFDEVEVSEQWRRRP